MDELSQKSRVIKVLAKEKISFSVTLGFQFNVEVRPRPFPDPETW